MRAHTLARARTTHRLRQDVLARAIKSHAIGNNLHALLLAVVDRRAKIVGVEHDAQRLRRHRRLPLVRVRVVLLFVRLDLLRANAKQTRRKEKKYAGEEKKNRTKICVERATTRARRQTQTTRKKAHKP